MNAVREIDYRDGKTLSVAMVHWERPKMSIYTNGKPDAAIVDDSLDSSPDEITMTLLAVSVHATRPEAKKVAVIGLGSGLTTHVLLLNSTIEVVDTIEIEKEMVDAARGFGRYNRSPMKMRAARFISTMRAHFSPAREPCMTPLSQSRPIRG